MTNWGPWYRIPPMHSIYRDDLDNRGIRFQIATPEHVNRLEEYKRVARELREHSTPVHLDVKYLDAFMAAIDKLIKEEEEHGYD